MWRLRRFSTNWQTGIVLNSGEPQTQSNIWSNFSRNSCSLEGRISYLSRAIMCVKSSEGAGELLHHLEEKMEV